MRTLAAILFAAALSGCVVTVPLRTADATRERVPTGRTYATAWVERLDALGHPTEPERVANLRVDGSGARWQTAPHGDTIDVPLSGLHAFTVPTLQHRSVVAGLSGLLIGGLAPIAVGAAMDARCEEGGACGWHVLEGVLVGHGTAVLGFIIGSVSRPDRRGPVRYVVTQARVD